MIELKCKGCDTGLFRVEDIARGLGKLPLRLTCHICGIQYIVKPDENGSPAVFYRKSRARWREMEIAGLKGKPAPEPTMPAPGSEESTEEQPEQVTAEEPEGAEGLSAEGSAEEAGSL